MSSRINKERENNSIRVSPIVLLVGIVLVVLFGYLFVASLDWSWSSSGSLRGHKSFTEYGLNYHKPPTYYHNDYSWLKWIFYPIDFIAFLIGCMLIKHGIQVVDRRKTPIILNNNNQEHITMKSFKTMYDQYAQLKEKFRNNTGDFTTNLLEYGIREDYYNKVDKIANLLYKFYTSKLSNVSIRRSLPYRLDDNHSENLIMCLLIDVIRCYDGLDHPTSFTTPEGIALLIMLDKFIGRHEIDAYSSLENVSSATLSLIDLIPYLSECSEEMGEKYALFLPGILEKKDKESEALYRQLMYILCKTIAEVDDDISTSEKEWLREIVLQNDDDPNNDIDIKEL